MPKKILILGADGYIGHPLTLHLRKQGHEVITLDNFIRRRRAESLTPLPARPVNLPIGVRRLYPSELLLDPDVIIHLAEQPSAPWSMRSPDHAEDTQVDNVAGTLRLLWLMREYWPDAHLIKLGSMGEYGTPGVPIPEGFMPGRCLHDDTLTCGYGGMSFPRQPGSFYHLSKVFDSMNIEFACRIWGLRSTDIMQGVVFGLNTWDPPDQVTRFDYDEYFGTVINRFCAQALAGHPLTVYGAGGQTRGYLPLRDSIDCLTRVVDNPPERGEYRVFNQYGHTASVNELARYVQCSCDLPVAIEHIENPRIEAESHTYKTCNDGLRALGYNPDWNFPDEIGALLDALRPYADRINTGVIKPTHSWG